MGGLGIVSLSTSQKKEVPGPPFAATSANNGLSVDSVSGKIVLGNDVGAAGDPAILLSDREIRTTDALFNLFNIILNCVDLGVTTALNGAQINMTGIAASQPTIDMQGGANSTNLIRAQGAANSASSVHVLTGAGGTSTVRIQGNTDQLNIVSDGSGGVRMEIGLVTVWSGEVATFNQQVGPGLVAFNGANFQINGNTTFRHFIESRGAGAYNVDRDLDSAKRFTNSAAATFNLPNMAAANFRGGFVFCLVVGNVAGVTIQAFAGQTIRFGSLATSAGGTLASTDVGAFVKLTLMDSLTWITETFNGAWVLT